MHLGPIAQTGWQHWPTKSLARFCHSREPLQPDRLERQAHRCMQRALQKAFPQRLENTANYRSALTLALHSRRVTVKEQAEVFRSDFSQIPSRLRATLTAPSDRKHVPEENGPGDPPDVRDVFFCGLDPKPYYAVTKVLDGFRF